MFLREVVFVVGLVCVVCNIDENFVCLNVDVFVEVVVWCVGVDGV